MKIADTVDIPIIVYNVPGRCGTDILSPTIARLSEHPNIVALKEATGELKRASEVVNLCPDDFVVLSGDDVNTLPIMAVGGKGVISVVANVSPSDVAEMCNAFHAGNLELARKLHYKTLPLAVNLFIETNPIPAKTALMLMGKLNGKVRLPLAPMTPANLESLRNTLAETGLT
jgi:4-hydroxy-tetrahydrodipicolinate synthase